MWNRFELFIHWDKINSICCNRKQISDIFLSLFRMDNLKIKCKNILSDYWHFKSRILVSRANLSNITFSMGKGLKQFPFFFLFGSLKTSIFFSHSLNLFPYKFIQMNLFFFFSSFGTIQCLLAYTITTSIRASLDVSAFFSKISSFLLHSNEKCA